MNLCQVVGCQNKLSVRGMCQGHAAKSRKGVTFKMKSGDDIAPPVIAADRRRCRWVDRKGNQCTNGKKGAMKLCAAHHQEAEDLKKCSRYDEEIELPEREHHEFLGSEDELSRMCE